ASRNRRLPKAGAEPRHCSRQVFGSLHGSESARFAAAPAAPAARGSGCFTSTAGGGRLPSASTAAEGPERAPRGASAEADGGAGSDSGSDATASDGSAPIGSADAPGSASFGVATPDSATFAGSVTRPGSAAAAVFVAALSAPVVPAPAGAPPAAGMADSVEGDVVGDVVGDGCGCSELDVEATGSPSTTAGSSDRA